MLRTTEQGEFEDEVLSQWMTYNSAKPWTDDTNDEDIESDSYWRVNTNVRDGFVMEWVINLPSIRGIGDELRVSQNSSTVSPSTTTRVSRPRQRTTNSSSGGGGGGGGSGGGGGGGIYPISTSGEGHAPFHAVRISSGLNLHHLCLRTAPEKVVPVRHPDDGYTVWNGDRQVEPRTLLENLKTMSKTCDPVQLDRLVEWRDLFCDNNVLPREFPVIMLDDVTRTSWEVPQCPPWLQHANHTCVPMGKHYPDLDVAASAFHHASPWMESNYSDGSLDIDAPELLGAWVLDNAGVTIQDWRCARLPDRLDSTAAEERKMPCTARGEEGTSTDEERFSYESGTPGFRQGSLSKKDIVPTVLRLAMKGGRYRKFWKTVTTVVDNFRRGQGQVLVWPLSTKRVVVACLAQAMRKYNIIYRTQSNTPSNAFFKLWLKDLVKTSGWSTLFQVPSNKAKAFDQCVQAALHDANGVLQRYLEQFPPVNIWGLSSGFQSSGLDMLLNDLVAAEEPNFGSL